MLSNTLNTNEIKNSAGTEQEFTRLSIGDRATEFAVISESPAYPHRLRISHTENGEGTARRRRSLVRFDKTVVGQVDATKVMKCSAQLVLDSPVGQLTTNALPLDVLANMQAFVSNTGGNTTIQFDGTGNGAVALVTGGL